MDTKTIYAVNFNDITSQFGSQNPARNQHHSSITNGELYKSCLAMQLIQLSDAAFETYNDIYALF